MLSFCDFSVGNRLLCGAIAAGTSWRKYCREWSGSIGGCGGGVAARGRVLPLLLVVELVIFAFWGKNASGSEVRLMLLPLITHGFLPEAPKQSATAKELGCC